MADVLRILSESFIADNLPNSALTNVSLLDSMPIITSSGKRVGKVAKEITDKSYCSTKKLFYYGVKLHALSFYNKGYLPYPKSIIILKATENDLTVFKDNWARIEQRTF